MKPLNLLAFLMLSLTLSAQIPKPIHSENLALGIGNALYSNALSGVHNPSRIQLDSTIFRIGVGYSNYYFTKGLNQVFAAAQFRIGRGGIAFSYSYFGWSTVQQHHLNLAYGLQVAKGFRIGIGVNYLITTLNGSESHHQGISPSIGLAYNHRRFQIAFHVDNPFAINWIASKEKLPIGFDFGFQFWFSKDLSICAELVKVLNTDLRFSLGLEYAIQNRFIPRIGFSILPLGISSGIEIRLNRFSLGLAFWYGHPLGPISHFDSTYEN